MMQTMKELVRQAIPPIIRQLEKRTPKQGFYPRSLLHRDMAPYLDQIKVARTASSIAVADRAIVERSIRSYHHSVRDQADLGDSMWKIFFTSKHQKLHDIFMKGHVDEVGSILRNPEASELFYGFSMLSQGLFDRSTSDEVLKNGCLQYLDWLLCLAEHFGAIRMHPETTAAETIPIDTLLTRLDEYLGIRISIPNPYPYEAGMVTSRGILTDRIPMALYQAWKIRQLTRSLSNPRVLEIGAGQGLGAYYAYQFGIRDYTIVDIPFSSISSGYFLLRTLGADNVVLAGEADAQSEQKFKFLTPQSFLRDEKTYDLIINVDSMTEMDVNVAHSYLQKVRQSAAQFLSINHEANRHTVREWILQSKVSLYERVPCYIRKGYLEELVRFH
jgi:hypothetical protein